MYLSRLPLNVRDRDVRRDLAHPYDMHRTVWRAFPSQEAGGPGRILFRVEPVRNRQPVVLVQSENQPDWMRLPTGYLVQAPDVKRCEFGELAPGQRLRFRLRANPTKRIAEKNSKFGSVMAGKRVGLVGEAAQIEWLARKSDRGGFRLIGQWVESRDPLSQDLIRLPNFRLDVIPEGWVRNLKRNVGGELLAVLFEGLLEVTAPELFRASLSRGIGPGKAFGFGLLSVART